MKVEGLVGDTAPFGYFDPLGFSKGKTLEQMTSYREAELKHGRMAMAATLGWIVQPSSLQRPRTHSIGVFMCPQMDMHVCSKHVAKPIYTGITQPPSE